MPYASFGAMPMSPRRAKFLPRLAFPRYSARGIFPRDAVGVFGCVGDFIPHLFGFYMAADFRAICGVRFTLAARPIFYVVAPCNRLRTAPPGKFTAPPIKISPAQIPCYLAGGEEPFPPRRGDSSEFCHREADGPNLAILGWIVISTR